MTPPLEPRGPWNVIEFPRSAIRYRTSPPPRPRRAPPSFQSIAWGLLAAASLLALGVLANAWWAVQRISEHVQRMEDAFNMPAASRPVRPVAAGRSVNVLIAGLDGEHVTGPAHEARSDAIMVLHLDADRRKAWLVSVPRDAWVPIPGHQEDKVNAAYSLGGPPLFVQTMEQLTGLRMDHLVVVDWTGLRRLTDAVGGVPVNMVPASADSAGSPQGEVALELSGDAALPYLSERMHLPNGDFDRVKRQHNFLRAFVRQALERHMLADPVEIRALASALGDAVRVDSRLTTQEMLTLAGSVCHLRAEDLTFVTAPTDGIAMRGEASVVVYDHAAADTLWRAVANDRVADFVASHPQLVTGVHVR